MTGTRDCGRFVAGLNINPVYLEFVDRVINFTPRYGVVILFFTMAFIPIHFFSSYI